MKIVDREVDYDDVLSYIKEPTVLDNYSKRLKEELKYEVEELKDVPNYTGKTLHVVFQNYKKALVKNT